MLSSHLLRVFLVVCLVAASGAGAEPATLQVVRTPATLAVVQNGRTIVAYNIESPPVPQGISPVYRRTGFLHPIKTPRGAVLTDTFPADHPHQHGVFSAWVKASYDGADIDFWNLAGGTGRVAHSRVVGTFTLPDRAGFEVELVHRAETSPPLPILKERWKVTAHATEADYCCFDLETVQEALTDKPLTVHKHHYGGVALRGPSRWLTQGDRDIQTTAPRASGEFLNDLGSDRQRGNLEHARWVALTGPIEGKPATIAVLCHPENPRAPQAARLHPTKPYFCFAPCADGEFRIDRQHPYRARYRYLATDAAPDPDWLERQWRQWTR